MGNSRKIELFLKRNKKITNNEKIARSSTRVDVGRLERRPERPDVVLAVRFINEFTRLNHRLKNVYEVTGKVYLSNNHVRG